MGNNDKSIHEEKKVISLPKLPGSWEAVTGEQMIEINRLRRKSKSRPEYLFRVFCFLEQITLTKKFSFDKVGNEHFFFRVKGKNGKPAGEPFPMEAWMVHELVSEHLSWITEPCTRLSDVVPYISIRGKRYASTGYAMARMTYQQHQFAMRYFNEIQRLEAAVVATAAGGSKEADTDRLADSITKTRWLFMATVFTPECCIGSKTVDGKVVVYDTPQTDFIFSTEQVERECLAFKEVKEECIDSVIQQFNGVMMHYQKIYPQLFKDGNAESSDMIKVEESTLNALQSELKFANYQTIYDSNAPFILGKLHAIILKAKEIEKMNERMKH